MSKNVPWDQIVDIVSRFPMGASIEEILIGLAIPPPRRTLQRWLAHLVQNQELIAIGKARARRYSLPKTFIKSEKGPLSLIPLSKEGQEIEAKVSLPIQDRRPVSYQREFLDSYSPNHSFYLSLDLRQKLHRFGESGDGQYPAGTYARQIFHRLMIDLSWNSSRLEGNTYSILETERLLEFGKAAEGKNLRETQMILNHKAAIEFLINDAEEIGVNRYTVLNLHTLLSDNLLSDTASCGRIRSIPVGIERSVYLPLAIPQVIVECFDLLIQKANQIKDPFEQSFFLMVHLPYLQPFDDVNKRTSRLAANIPLVRKNLCPLSFIDVPKESYINGLLGVYELNRVELLRDVFVWAYERSCALYAATRKSLGDPDPFRMQYRNFIVQVVGDVVRSAMSKVEAIAFIRRFAFENVPELEQDQFIQIVERELQGLHEGNIARYRLRPFEYENWRKDWR